MKELRRFKPFAQKLLSNRYRKRSVLKWSERQLPQVLIETWPGFTEEDWLQTLRRDFENWVRSVEV